MLIYFIIGAIVSMVILKLFPGPKDSTETFLAIAFFWPLALIFTLFTYLSMVAFVLSGRHRTREGKVLKLTEMTEEHLKNCVNYGNDDIENPYWKLQVPRFEKELARRK